MSELRVEVVKIDKVEKHPNADRLDICYIAGWTCVTQKDVYKAGDKVLYVPIDSILPQALEEHIFPPGSKIKLEKSRVRTIKIRGAISQGMLLSLQDLVSGNFLPNDKYAVGMDLAKKLGITKFEPPLKASPQSGIKQVKQRYKHPEFQVYTDINNFKWYPDLFKEGEHIVILEKVHGSSFRCGLLPFHANTLWKKVKKLVGLAPKYEFVYGSHRVQLQYKRRYDGFYDKNIYMEMVKKYDLENRIEPGQVVYGEVYGFGVQKDYHYGCKQDERKLVVFDIKENGVYKNHLQVKRWCEHNKIPHAPIEYTGPYPGNDHIKDKWVEGPSSLHPEQKIREGVVIKPFVEEHCYMGRKILKWKSDSFLLTQVDDTH